MIKLGLTEGFPYAGHSKYSHALTHLSCVILGGLLNDYSHSDFREKKTGIKTSNNLSINTQLVCLELEFEPELAWPQTLNHCPIQL